MSRFILKKFDILGLLLILVTPLLLLETFGYWKGSFRAWPIFPFLVGIGFMVLFRRTSKTNLIMLGIGTFLVEVSLLFFYFNFAGWQKIIQLWPLFIALAGVAGGVCAYYGRNRIVWLVSFGLFILGWIFIFIFSLSYWFWPISLALAGLSILILNHLQYGPKSEKSNPR